MTTTSSTARRSKTRMRCDTINSVGGEESKRSMGKSRHIRNDDQIPHRPLTTYTHGDLEAIVGKRWMFVPSPQPCRRKRMPNWNADSGNN